MSDRERIQKPHSRESALQICPKRFIFYDKVTGTERFGVKASPDGTIPKEQAASLIAIHCLVRGRNPKDFGVMIAVEEDLLDGLLPIAKRLMQACAGLSSAIPLSPRQQQVLRALMQDCSNKEIAAKLNLSVRTVKFHVSALLGKFKVSSRVALIRKASDALLPEEPASVIHGYHQDIRLLRADGSSALAREQVGIQPLGVAALQRASR